MPYELTSDRAHSFEHIHYRYCSHWHSLFWCILFLWSVEVVNNGSLFSVFFSFLIKPIEEWYANHDSWVWSFPFVRHSIVLHSVSGLTGYRSLSLPNFLFDALSESALFVLQCFNYNRGRATCVYLSRNNRTAATVFLILWWHICLGGFKKAMLNRVILCWDIKLNM